VVKTEAWLESFQLAEDWSFRATIAIIDIRRPKFRTKLRSNT